MIDRGQIDKAIKEAEGLLGQRRVWIRGYGLPDVVVESCGLNVRLNFDADSGKESIEVAEMIWCNYVDAPFGTEKVWFDKKRFCDLKVAEAKE